MIINQNIMNNYNAGRINQNVAVQRVQRPSENVNTEVKNEKITGDGVGLTISTAGRMRSQNMKSIEELKKEQERVSLSQELENTSSNISDALAVNQNALKKDVNDSKVESDNGIKVSSGSRKEDVLKNLQSEVKNTTAITLESIDPEIQIARIKNSSRTSDEFRQSLAYLRQAQANSSHAAALQLLS